MSTTKKKLGWATKQNGKEIIHNKNEYYALFIYCNGKVYNFFCERT